MENTKVILTVEQAQAFELLKETWAECPEAEMQGILIGEKLGAGWWSESFVAANSIEDADFISALYNGYEVDKPVEDRLHSTLKMMYDESLDKYFVADSGTHEESYHDGYNDCIVDVADKLGIKVDGVND